MSKKKILSLCLSLVLLLSSLCPLAFAEDEKLNYVLLGDSIAWGAGVYNSDEACFGRIVANTNGYNYINHAVNGYTTAALIRHLQREDVAQAVSDADIISLSIGGNDYLQQNLPRLFVDYLIGKYDIIDDIAEDLNTRFATAIDMIRELNPDATLLVQTLYNPRFDLIRNFYDIAVQRVNNAVNGYLAAHPGAYEIIDVHAKFTADHPEYIAADSIHPSAVGNEVIAKMVLEKLYELGLGENTEPVIQTVGIDQIPFTSKILQVIRAFFDKIFGLFA